MRADVLEPGTFGVDASEHVSREQSRALRATTPRPDFIMRAFDHGPGFEAHNCTAAEMADHQAEGFGVGLYAQFRKGGWSRLTGLADAERWIAAATAIADVAGCIIWCDFEGNDMTDEAIEAYAAAVGPRLSSSKFFAGAYNVRWDPVKNDKLRSFGFSFIWDAADGLKPLAGAELAQGKQIAIAGVIVDTDTIEGGRVIFCFADEAEDTSSTPATPPVPPPPPTLTRVRSTYLDEARSFVGVNAGTERERYEDGIMPSPPEPKIAHVGYDDASGCALWQRRFIRGTCTRLGITMPALLANPYRMSKAIVDLLEMAGKPEGQAIGIAAGAWVPAPKDTSRRPSTGDIVYIGGGDGTYEHVFCTTGDDECIEGGVVVKGHQAVRLDSIGWNVVGGVLHVGHRRANGWIDLDALFARFSA